MMKEYKDRIDYFKAYEAQRKQQRREMKEQTRYTNIYDAVAAATTQRAAVSVSIAPVDRATAENVLKDARCRFEATAKGYRIQPPPANDLAAQMIQQFGLTQGDLEYVEPIKQPPAYKSYELAKEVADRFTSDWVTLKAKRNEIGYSIGAMQKITKTAFDYGLLERMRTKQGFLYRIKDLSNVKGKQS